jgi:hypothetical protein
VEPVRDVLLGRDVAPALVRDGVQDDGTAEVAGVPEGPLEVSGLPVSGSMMPTPWKWSASSRSAGA